MTARDDAFEAGEDATARQNAIVILEGAEGPELRAGLGWALLDLADAVREFVDVPRPELRKLETAFGPATVEGIPKLGDVEPVTHERADEIREGVGRDLNTGPLHALRDVEAQLDRWVVEGDGATVVMLGSMVAQLRTLIRVEGAKLAPLSLIKVES